MNTMPTDLPTRAAKSAADRRVLFITRKWGPAVGGMETYSERLTEELGKLRPVDLIALKGRSNGQPPSWLALLLFPLAVLRRLALLKRKPAVVLLGDMAIWPLGLLALIFFPSARLFLSAHGTDVAYGARGGLRGSLYSAYLKSGARLLRGAGVIANSRATRDRLEAAGWRTEAVIPLATDLSTESSDQFDPRTLVFAGRLVKRKGCGWFIREVLPHLPKHRLMVIGTRWDETENAALDHPRVRFLGPKPQSELTKHFARAGIVIVPNIELPSGEYEGFGLVAPEAASSGGVVLAARLHGLKDAVIDGETGFLLESGNALEWADKIREISAWNERDRAKFIASSQEKTRHHFNWQRVARQTLQAIRS